MLGGERLSTVVGVGVTVSAGLSVGAGVAVSVGVTKTSGVGVTESCDGVGEEVSEGVELS